jgi:malonyl-CoA O-methyltransferase
MQGESATLPGLTARAVHRAFDRASRSFDGADPVHSEARARLLGRLDLLTSTPARIVDLGCATGQGALALAARYPQAQVLALDRSIAMLARARGRLSAQRTVRLVAADAERLPLSAHSIGLVFANLVLPWCAPEAVFAEAARVLTDDGLIVFATFGPDTLIEVRRAWAKVDDRAHVHRFLDMHDIGDLALAAGLRDPVVDVDRLEVSYAGPDQLITELRACAGTNQDAARRRALTGSHRWRRFVAALGGATGPERLSVSVELVFGQAWGGGIARAQTQAPSEVRIPVSALPDRARGSGH